MNSMVVHRSVSHASRQCSVVRGAASSLRRKSSSTATRSLLPGETTEATNNLRPQRTWLWMALGLTTWGGYRSIQIVETGKVAVVEVLGVVQDDLLPPGHHIVPPWARVTKFNLQQRQVVIATKTRIKGGLFVEMDLLVLYKLDPAKIKDIYIQVGTLKDEQDWHLESVARSVLHAAVARKSMEQMHDTQQLDVCREVQTRLAQIYQPEGVLVEQVLFRKVQLPDYLVTAIQDLHQLDLDISAEKRVVDGKLAVARGTAAARSVLKGENPHLRRPPPLTTTTTTTVTRPLRPSAKPNVLENSKVNAKEQPEEEKEKTLFERFLPYFYGDSKDKPLPTLKAYTRQVKEDRRSYFPSFFAKEGKAKEFMDSVKQPPPEKPVDEKETKISNMITPAKAASKVEEAKLPTLKTESKQELKNPGLKLEEATTKGKTATGETEKES